jgi:hypothetical protein
MNENVKAKKTTISLNSPSKASHKKLGQQTKTSSLELSTE